MGLNVEPEEVRLKLAYTWDCEQCGRENLIRTFVKDSGNDQEVMVPYMDEIAAVFCKFCGKGYKTENFDEEDYDDEGCADDCEDDEDDEEDAE